MKSIKTILSGMLLMSCLTVAAQEPAAKTEYVFQPHWYVQLQAGGQYTIGEVDTKDLLSPNAQVAIGYNFNPIVGLRLNVNAWQSKGGLQQPLHNLEEVWKWKYVAPQLDVMINLSNAFLGYNPTRLFTLSAFGGLGANIAFSNDEAAKARQVFLPYYDEWNTRRPLEYLWDGTKTRFMGQFGLAGDFRVNDRVSIGLEVSANTLSDRYNSKNGGNTDWYYNALVGVKINLGATHTTRTVEAPKPQIIEKTIIKEVPVQQPAQPQQQQMQSQLTNGQATNASAQVEIIRREIFFENAVTKIKAADEQKIKEVADFLMRNPNAKVTVEGYASKDQKSTAAYASMNKRLAGQRAANVVNILKKKYGIPANRIISVNKGDTEQPFPTNDANRVAICVAQ